MKQQNDGIYAATSWFLATNARLEHWWHLICRAIQTCKQTVLPLGDVEATLFFDPIFQKDI